MRCVKGFSGNIGAPVSCVFCFGATTAVARRPTGSTTVNGIQNSTRSSAEGQSDQAHAGVNRQGQEVVWLRLRHVPWREQGRQGRDLAKDMNPAVADFRDPVVLKARTDGELFYILKNGKDGMPAENRGSDNALWDFVNYIRSFATKKPSSEQGGTAPETSH